MMKTLNGRMAHHINNFTFNDAKLFIKANAYIILSAYFALSFPYRHANGAKLILFLLALICFIFVGMMIKHKGTPQFIIGAALSIVGLIIINGVNINPRWMIITFIISATALTALMHKDNALHFHSISLWDVDNVVSIGLICFGLFTISSEFTLLY